MGPPTAALLLLCAFALLALQAAAQLGCATFVFRPGPTQVTSISPGLGAGNSSAVGGSMAADVAGVLGRAGLGAAGNLQKAGEHAVASPPPPLPGVAVRTVPLPSGVAAVMRPEGQGSSLRLAAMLYASSLCVRWRDETGSVWLVVGAVLWALLHLSGRWGAPKWASSRSHGQPVTVASSHATRGRGSGSKRVRGALGGAAGGGSVAHGVELTVRAP